VTFLNLFFFGAKKSTSKQVVHHGALGPAPKKKKKGKYI
jgi:hypothetical protein